VAAPRNVPRIVPSLAVVLFCASSLVSTAAARTLLHKPAPAFVRNDLEGHPVDLTALRGHVVLLSFWATWCAPCQVEMPRFVEWQTRFGSQGLQIIGVSLDDEEAPVRDLTAQRGVNYPIAMGDAKLARAWGGILGLPVTFLIDRQGRVAARFKGEADLTVMERTLRRLLDAKR
jgi:cytochrome c biogenesis protein CcmG/thiol:disulfide interchange protein DsbE